MTYTWKKAWEETSLGLICLIVRTRFIFFVNKTLQSVIQRVTAEDIIHDKAKIIVPRDGNYFTRKTVRNTRVG